MSQVNIRPAEALSYICEETSFAVPDTYTRLFPVSDSVDLSPTQTEHDVTDQSIYLYNEQDPVKGPKSGSVKFSHYLRPPAQVIGSSGGSSTTAANSISVPLKACFGGCSAAVGETGALTAGQGTGIATATSTTSVTVTTGEGARGLVGQWVLVPVGGVLEPTRISAVSTDTWTFDLALSGATAVATNTVAQMYNFYPKASNTKSLSFRHALYGDDASETGTHKWQLDGCVPDIQFKLDANGLLSMDCELKCADWTGPSDQAFTTPAVGSNDLGTPWAMQDATCILQAAATTTRTQYHLHSFALKLNHGMAHIPSLGGVSGTLTTSGVMRTGQRLFAEATVRFQSDTAADSTWWTDRTALQLVVMVPQGTGTSKRWCVMDLPQCVVVNKPRVIKENGFTLTEITLRSKMRNTSGATELARAPFVFAIG